MPKLRGSDVTRCRRTARAVLDECDVRALPINPEEICRKKGIQYSHETELPPGCWGALVRENGNFVILVSASCPTVGHRRFSASHELGHYHLEGHLAALLSSGTHYSSPPHKATEPLELEANVFAAELLMPKPLISPIMDGADIGLASVRVIANRCETSLTSAAIRYVELTPDPVAIIVSHEGTIEFSSVSSSLWSYPGVARRKPQRGDDLVRGTAAYRLARSPAKVRSVAEDSDTASLDFWFPGCEPGGELVEESVGLGRYGRVLTVLSTMELPDFEDWR